MHNISNFNPNMHYIFKIKKVCMFSIDKGGWFTREPERKVQMVLARGHRAQAQSKRVKLPHVMTIPKKASRYTNHPPQARSSFEKFMVVYYRNM